MVSTFGALPESNCKMCLWCRVTSPPYRECVRSNATKRYTKDYYSLLGNGNIARSWWRFAKLNFFEN